MLSRSGAGTRGSSTGAALQGRPVTSLHWSPQGKFLIIAGLTIVYIVFGKVDLSGEKSS